MLKQNREGEKNEILDGFSSVGDGHNWPRQRHRVGGACFFETERHLRGGRCRVVPARGTVRHRAPDLLAETLELNGSAPGG